MLWAVLGPRWGPLLQGAQFPASFLRLQVGLYGVGDGVGALLMPPGAISLLVDADTVSTPGPNLPLR